MPLLPLKGPSSAVAAMSRRREPPRGTTSTERAEGLAEQYPSAVLAGRRSVRHFSGRAVPVEELARVLATAHAAQHRQWPAADHGDPGLALVVAAHQVDELSSALQLWRPETAAFDSCGTPKWLWRMPAWYAAAPALILICGSIGRTDGISYSQLLVQAGALGHEIWLAARSRGLECSVYGQAVHELSDVLTPGSRHLFTVALGYAVEG